MEFAINFCLNSKRVYLGVIVFSSALNVPDFLSRKIVHLEIYLNDTNKAQKIFSYIDIDQSSDSIYSVFVYLQGFVRDVLTLFIQV